MTTCNAVGKHSVILLAALVLACGATSAQTQKQKEMAPEGSTPKDFVLPQKTIETLDNGLRISSVQFGTVPKATIAVVVSAGNLNEGNQTWLADLTGDFLLEGTTSRSAEGIAREAAAMGGQVTVNVGEDLTTISGDVLAEYAPQMAALLADIVQNPRFPNEELDRLTRDRLRQLSVAKIQPEQMAVAAFREALYGDHPYGNLLPEESQLQNYTVQDVRAFFDGNFGAARTHVFIAGRFDSSATITAIRQAFADWREGPATLVNVPKPASGKVAVDVIDRPDASQSNLYLGLPIISPGHDDWIPLQISNTLLGGFFSSRITRNIREDKGYTYSPYSTLSVRYRDGYWAQVAAVTTDVTGPALEEIFKEIRTLQETPPSIEELDGVKNYSAGVFVLQNSTRGGIINVLSYLDHHDLPDTYLSNYVSEVFAITPEQVSEIANEYLQEDEMTVIVVGDRSQVSEQVQPWIGSDE
ncbi:MAG: pitrilysin family protein [Woeseia sp.]